MQGVFCLSVVLVLFLCICVEPGEFKILRQTPGIIRTDHTANAEKPLVRQPSNYEPILRARRQLNRRQYGQHGRGRPQNPVQAILKWFNPPVYPVS